MTSVDDVDDGDDEEGDFMGEEEAGNPRNALFSRRSAL